MRRRVVGSRLRGAATLVSEVAEFPESFVGFKSYLPKVWFATAFTFILHPCLYVVFEKVRSIGASFPFTSFM